MSEVLIGTRVKPAVPTSDDKFTARRKVVPAAAIQIATAQDRSGSADRAAEAARKAVEVTKVTEGKRAPKAPKPPPAPKPPRPMSKAALRRLRAAANKTVREAKRAEKVERAAKRKPAPPLPLHTAENIRKAVAVRQIAPGEGAIRLAAIDDKLGTSLDSALAGWRLVGACPVEVPADLVALARASGGVVKVDARGATVKAETFGYRPVAA